MFVSASQGKSDGNDTLIFERIEYIYNLKQQIDDKVWKGFAAEEFDLPLIYYTDSVCYVANPTQKFIALFRPSLAFKKQKLKIYKTKLLDSIPFHMETSMTFGAPVTAYNYKSPFMKCSSLEITQNNVPGVHSTELWATMVIHEYFHGFQFKHPAHLAYFEKNISRAADTLQKLYELHRWYKDGVDKENKILLTMLATQRKKEIQSLTDSFFSVRQQRRLQAKRELNVDVAELERSYETMEGTARYVEFSLYASFMKKSPAFNLQKSDSAYHSYREFQNFTIEKDEWLYLAEKTTYFYATGFNLVRLLDKLKVPYRTVLFNEGSLSLEQILATLPKINGG